MLSRSAARTTRLSAAAIRCQSQPQASLFSTAQVVDETEEGTSKYPRLMEPLDLGPDIGRLANRAMMGSMHTGLEGNSMPSWLVSMLGDVENHDTLDQMAAYFHERAKGGVSLMVTGGIAPNLQGWTGPFSSQLTNNEEMLKHQVVTEAVHSVDVPIHGTSESVPAKICMQILHTGRYAYHPMAVSASATRSPISPFPARELSKSGIESTISDFVRAAVLAKEAGYDGVEIMGSEGYLLSQFLSPRTNLRTDEYGGSLENRSRMPLEIIQRTRQAVGKDFIIIFRLSLLDLVEKGMTFDEALQLATQVEASGATIINTGIGWHEARVPTIATSVPRASFAFPTKRLKEAGVVSIPIVATNRINHPQTAEDLLESHTCDLISMARPFLADPYLMEKSRQGREDEINTCIGCNQACLDHVFVGKISSCLVNPAACHETEIQPSLLPETQRLTIGVVGAGPAGCSFAITARKMGHDVHLYDKDDKIGGQFNMAKRIPGKEEFHEALRYFGNQLEKHGVNLHLGTVLSASDMDKMSHVDKWIDATGVEPRDPHIPGQEHSKVMSYIDVLKHKKPIGEKVAIIGAGGIGFDVAEYLIHWDGKDHQADDVDIEEFYRTWGIDSKLQTRGGLVKPAPSSHHSKRQVYLLQRKKGKLGASLGKTTGWIHRTTLKESGAVEMIHSTKYKEVDENGNLHIEQNGKERVLEVDSIILCAGQVEQTRLRKEASESLAQRLFAIGGAYKAGELDAKRAIDMGTRLALRIHEGDLEAGRHVEKTSAKKPGIEEKLFSYMKRLM